MLIILFINLYIVILYLIIIQNIWYLKSIYLQQFYLYIYKKTYVNLCTYNIIYKQKCDREWSSLQSWYLLLK